MRRRTTMSYFFPLYKLKIFQFLFSPFIVGFDVKLGNQLIYVYIGRDFQNNHKNITFLQSFVISNRKFNRKDIR